MGCICRRKKVDTESGLRDLRKIVQPRNWETRNKFRCTFCGGQSCKHENWTLHKNPAIRGLNSDWITENILATQRLSSRLIEEFKILTQFREVGISSVFNLQLPGEHPYCGDGLVQNRAFTYTPEELYAEGLYFFNMGWPDMHVPGINDMANIVQMMSLPLEKGEKIAVHCHAGYGRTGLAIACYLLYSTDLLPDQVISLVRSKRPKCIQTSKQTEYVFTFFKFLQMNREIFSDNFYSLTEYFYHQTVLIHGNALKTIDYVPKLVYECTKIIENRLALGLYSTDHVSASFYDLERPVFSSPTYLTFLGLVPSNEVVISVDETVMNSPAVTLIQQVEAKIKMYKHILNQWKWEGFLEEKDVRVHIQLLIDWLENHQLQPVIYDPKFLDFLDDCAQCGSFIYKKEGMPKANFKVIDRIVKFILIPLYGKKDYDQVLTRTAICLLGKKQKWSASFEGRKMKKIVFTDSDDQEVRLKKILKNLSEKLVN